MLRITSVRFLEFFIWVFFFLMSPESAYAENPPLNMNLRKSVTEVVPGLVHTHLAADSTAEKLPLNINVLKADLNKISVQLVMAMDQIIGQETTSSMAVRHRALAGVNGGYSYSNYPWNIYHGDPSQFFVLDGKILSEPRTPGRSSLGILTKDGKQTLIVDTPLLEIEAVFDNTRKIDITGINRKRKGADSVLRRCFLSMLHRHSQGVHHWHIEPVYTDSRKHPIVLT